VDRALQPALADWPLPTAWFEPSTSWRMRPVHHDFVSADSYPDPLERMFAGHQGRHTHLITEASPPSAAPTTPAKHHPAPGRNCSNDWSGTRSITGRPASLTGDGSSIGTVVPRTFGRAPTRR
jgi:hypothetical protein